MCVQIISNSVKAAEWPPVCERAAHSVSRMLSWFLGFDLCSDYTSSWVLLTYHFET